MRTFYTGSDIEDLAASGVRQLEVGSGVALTDTARERAEELGIALVVPGSAPAKKAVAASRTREGRGSASPAEGLSARAAGGEEPAGAESRQWRRTSGGSTGGSGKRAEEARRLGCASRKW